MTKIVEAINQASKVWEHAGYEAMKALFAPLYEEIKQDTNNFKKGHPVPWHYQYFSESEQVNHEILVQFWTMSAACFE